MKDEIKKIFVFFLILLICFTATAQDNYHAIHWTTENGLSQDNINSILKDEYGFLWMSTSYGISRFDGSTFKNYFSGTTNKDIINNDTKKLIEDSLHNIWIGTTNGLSRYDIKADTFTQFLPDSNLPGHAIIPFSATRNMVYCIEGVDGPALITAYDSRTLKRKILMRLMQEDRVYDGTGVIYTIFDSATNCVWLLEGHPDVAGGGLYEISISDGKRKHYQWSCYRNILNHSHWSEAMCYDRKRNAIWINSPDGLIEFTLRDKQFHDINALNHIEHLKNYSRFVGIDIDTMGRLWFATKPKGIIIYDPSKQSVTFPFNNNSALQEQTSDGNLCLYCDRDNIAWSGFYDKKGLYQLVSYAPVIKQYVAAPDKADCLSSDVVYNCISSNTGQMWLGTPNGLNIFNPVTEKFEILRESDLHVSKGLFILPFVVNNTANKAWLFTDALYEMDLHTKKCRRVVYKDNSGQTLMHRLHYQYTIAYQNGCLVGGRYDNEIDFFILNEDSIAAHQILSFPPGEVEINIVSDDDHIFFMNIKTSTTLTYSQKNGKWIRTPNALDSVVRKKIFYDPIDTTYWLTLDRQLLHYDKYFRFINKYQFSVDLPGHGDIISLIPDNRNNIWFNNDVGVFRLDLKTGNILMLTERDGFKKQDFASCITPVAKDIFGDIYFPCGTAAQGFDRVIPGQFREDYPPSRIYLRSLAVNESLFPLVTGVNNLQTLSLKYFQNNISLETGVIDYYSKGQNHIRYKLRGINNDWEYAPANYTIRYDGLPSGKYTLVMQASDAVGEFTGPAKNIFIQIAPPFWKRWWFISLVLLLVAVAIYALFQFQLKQKMQVLTVRQKLHRDLHDDVGATLSSIKIYSEVLQNNAGNGLITDLIKNNATDMIDRLEIIAWATDPQHDTFKSFKELMLKHASPLCYAKNIDLDIQSNGLSENMTMPGDIRQNLFLIFKEAINNIIKYSGGSQCNVQIFIADHKFYFTIKDNGNGFSGTIKGNGNGLKNMEKRAKALNGVVEIQSEKGKGTAINIALHYPFKIPSFWYKNKGTL